MAGIEPGPVVLEATIMPTAPQQQHCIRIIIPGNDPN